MANHLIMRYGLQIRNKLLFNTVKIFVIFAPFRAFRVPNIHAIATNLLDFFFE